ncbi:STAS domain-containing protein [Actinophytocola glycyrrhizae]|uniref:Anti-sigma factor antagonist n=1 Tax=Actinophytocola glycyrrhizae TaxID=2044873 RepID=A0ABV9SFY9_9PSEU
MSENVRLRIARPAPDCVVLTVFGEIDLVTAPELASALEDHLDGTPCVVVDLTDVTFFGSLGLATLVRLSTLAEANGVRLALVPGPLVLRTMELTRTEEMFFVYESVADARRYH